MWTMNFQMFKLDLQKAEEPEIKLPTFIGSSKKQRVPGKHLFLLYCLCQTFDCVDHNKLWKILKEMGIPDHLTCLLRNLYVDWEATVRIGHGTIDWLKIGNAVWQGCILSPCLTSFQSTSCEMPGWVTQKESRLQAEISPTSDMQMTTL